MCEALLWRILSPSPSPPARPKPLPRGEGPALSSVRWRRGSPFSAGWAKLMSCLLALIILPFLVSCGTGPSRKADADYPQPRSPAEITRSPPSGPTLAPGFEYVHRRTGDQPWSMHVLKIARTNQTGRFATTLGQGSVFGLEPVARQLRRLPETNGRPVVAVNGDFFVIKPGPFQGDPRGLQITEGELVSAPAGTAAFWMDAQGQPRLETVYSRLRVIWPDGRETRVGLNQERTNGMVVLYTPTLGPSTRTSNGLEIILGHEGGGTWLPLQAGRHYEAQVLEVAPGANTSLRPGCLVLSVSPDQVESLPRRSAGQLIKIVTATTPTLGGVSTAISGGPFLVRAGEVQSWRPPQPRHPRTAFGWSDTHFVLVVVDGRQPGLSVGMTFPELAETMRELGCREAMNLDGGGSSTFWLDGHVLNSPSDGHPRHVANSLVWVQAE